MATRYYYHVLSTLLLTNRLLPVCTETAKEFQGFDFDGTRGVSFSFKIDVAAGKEECFYQFAKLGAKIYISFEVLRGADRNINFFLLDPSHTVIESKYDSPHGTSEDTVKMPGHYMMCFDNSLSRFSSKLVYVNFASMVTEEWNKYYEEIREMDALSVNFTDILERVELALLYVTRFQIFSTRNVLRDWYLVSGNNRYIGYWSTALCVIVVAAAVGQVYFLRRLFTVPKLTPSLKPRA